MKPAAAFPGLAEMMTEMRDAPAIVQPSSYWESLNDANIAMLHSDGFENFKRTINRNYFSWVPRSPRNEHFRIVARDWHLLRVGVSPMFAKLADGEDIEFMPHALQRRTHAVFLALLWEYVRARDTRGLLAEADEPSLGNPITVGYRGRSVSQDLCNSAHEITSMLETLPKAHGPSRVIELGGGYGRVAWLMLRAFPRVQYILVDIPPALAIAQQYLTTLYPERTTFRFRAFGAYEEVAEELSHADIAFLTPNQLDLLPSIAADLFVNISSLHEMRREQISHYIDQVARHCTGLFYTKQWQRSVNVADDLVICRDEYPIPSSWEKVYSRDHPLQAQFFEALYRVSPEPVASR
ncbi:putative sugar O-methyltransferase [Aromatoleum sp.]|uniref:putative sugar O-methyltransferase n=1 Tax=Aromatoleum sp. TaxID=2307007 RepID=UPI002FCA3F80